MTRAAARAAALLALLAVAAAAAAAVGAARSDVTVTIAENGAPHNSREMIVPAAQDLKRFLYAAGLELRLNARRAFLADGAEVASLDQLDAHAVVFISEGEALMTKVMHDDALDPFPDEQFKVVLLPADDGGPPVVHIDGLGGKLPIGIPISITTITGWGNFAFHFAYEMFKNTRYTPILLEEARNDVFLYPLERALRRKLSTRVDQFWPIDDLIELNKLKPAVRFDFPLILALASEMRGITDYRGSRNIGFIFFEDTHFSENAMKVAHTYDLIIGGSSWNSDILTYDYGLNFSVPIIQGVDVMTHKPAPKQGKYPGRFVIFSGGKLEFRKSQDLVVAAFKKFRARHPEALLLVAWQNFWHQTIDGIEQTGYVNGKPSWDQGGVLLIEDWLEQQNGLPKGSVLSLGPVPNSRFAEELHEADVAVFPNRCEGGTNLVAMEAFAGGVPTIISANTGHLDIIDDDRCFPLRRQFRTPRGHWKGMKGWGEADINEIVENLEFVYNNPNEARRRAMNAAEFIQAHSWELQVPRYIDAIDKVSYPGAWENYIDKVIDKE